MIAEQDVAIVASPGLTFDAESHTYRVNGREIPSTTQVLQDNRLRTDFSGVSPYVLEHARRRGVAVHAATHYADEGTLDVATLDPEIVPYLAAWSVFLIERSVQIVEMDKRYVHRTLGYAGMIDRIVRIPGRHRTIVVDVKTGDQSGVAYQTAAYAELYRDAMNESLPSYRWSVLLAPERGVPYVVTEYKDPRDWRTFRAALDLTFARAAQGQSWRAA